MKHIKDVIFFEDYGLYAEVVKEATVSGMGVGSYLAVCMEEYLNRDNAGKKIVINKAEEMYAYSEKLKNQGFAGSISQVMEKICRAKINGIKGIVEVVESVKIEDKSDDKSDGDKKSLKDKVSDFLSLPKG
jgi:hypothetical protein